MADPMSDDDGEVAGHLSSSSPEDIAAEDVVLGESPQRAKKPPMTPPTPESGDLSEESSNMGLGSPSPPPPPSKPMDISSDSNNVDENEGLDYSDGEAEQAEGEQQTGEQEKHLSEGELEEGELESDSDDEPIQQQVNEKPLQKDRSRSISRSVSPVSKRPLSRNDGICKFHLRGACTWGEKNCRFYHPSDAECERIRREEGLENRRSITRVYQRGPSPQVKEEDAWERGLKQARERMKKASELKKDPDFDKKRLLMSANDSSPRRCSDSEDSADDKRCSRSPISYRERLSRRMPDPVPFFPVGSNGRPPSLIDVMRSEDRRRTEAAKDLGPQVLYPSRNSRDTGRNRRPNNMRSSPIPLRDIAPIAAKTDVSRRNGGPSLRERCRQREADQQAKKERGTKRRSSSSHSSNSDRKSRKRNRRRSRSRSTSYSSRSSSVESRSSSGSRSTHSRSSSGSRSSGSRSSSRSSDSRRSGRNRKRSCDEKKAKRRDLKTVRSFTDEREPSSAADLSSFRIPKRRRSQRSPSRSRSRSPMDRNRNTIARVRNERRRTSSNERKRRRRDSSDGDERAPAAYRTNVDPLFGLEEIPLSPEGDPISSEDEPDPKRDEVIRERDNVSDSSKSGSGGSSASSSDSEGEENAKTSSSSAVESRKETPTPPQPPPEVDDKERRRQELLDQLKSVEEAIARKRGKLTA